MQSSASWVFTKISSVLAIFDRVETKTAAVSNGLEMTDQNTNEIYCVQIKNGEFAKQDTEEIVLLLGSSSSSVNLSAEGSKRAEKRKKNYESALSHLPAYTRLGFAIAIFSGVKLEVNPGELLDFVLEIVLIDIYRDDVYLRNTGRKGK
jgi:hypothetical protein